MKKIIEKIVKCILLLISMLCVWVILSGATGEILQGAITIGLLAGYLYLLIS